VPIRRPHYFAGRLLGVDDFVAEQRYQRERLARFARATVGAGVVSGLDVRCTRREIRVTAGVAIDCLGELIEVPDGGGTLSVPSPDVTARWVLLTYQEQPGAELLPTPDGGALPRWIEESAVLSLTAIDPMQGHRRARHRYRPCGHSHGVPLARLQHRRGQWRLDPAWRPSRL
jgi:hypothetical protein